MNKKVIIVINGQGGVGKDAFCDAVAGFIKCKTVSSIDVIKRIAIKGGWMGGKTDKDRRFLFDLKSAFSAYNDLPFKAMMKEVKRFVSKDEVNQILFVHIRESEEIEKFRKAANKYCPCVTLLITRSQVEREFGNMADDNVKDYPYDFVFKNETSNLQFLKDEAASFMKRIIF